MAPPGRAAGGLGGHLVDAALGDDPDLARLIEALERIETSVVAQHEEGTK